MYILLYLIITYFYYLLLFMGRVRARARPRPLCGGRGGAAFDSFPFSAGRDKADVSQHSLVVHSIPLNMLLLAAATANTLSNFFSERLVGALVPTTPRHMRSAVNSRMGMRADQTRFDAGTGVECRVW